MNTKSAPPHGERAAQQDTAEQTTQPGAAATDGASLTELYGVPVSVVTRAQLIEGGDLVDVSVTATEAGFRIPVAMSRAVWCDCVEWGEADGKRQTYQDEAGRLWDVLWMAHLAARRNRDGSALRFQLYRVPRGGAGHMPRLVVLKMLCGPGDAGEPVITILQPSED